MKLLRVVLTLLVLGGSAQAQDVVGRYRVQGTNFDGSIYAGEAVITPTSDVTCEITWDTEGTISKGICMRDGITFTAAYELEGKIGLVIYLILDDGSLEGSWTIAGVDAVGTEVLTPIK
jgi:hypothetical protein